MKKLMYGTMALPLLLGLMGMQPAPVNPAGEAVDHEDAAVQKNVRAVVPEQEGWVFSVNVDKGEIVISGKTYHGAAQLLSGARVGSKVGFTLQSDTASDHPVVSRIRVMPVSGLPPATTGRSLK